MKNIKRTVSYLLSSLIIVGNSSLSYVNVGAMHPKSNGIVGADKENQKLMNLSWDELKKRVTFTDSSGAEQLVTVENIVIELVKNKPQQEKAEVLIRTLQRLSNELIKEKKVQFLPNGLLVFKDNGSLRPVRVSDLPGEYVSRFDPNTPILTRFHTGDSPAERKQTALWMFSGLDVDDALYGLSKKLGMDWDDYKRAFRPVPKKPMIFIPHQIMRADVSGNTELAPTNAEKLDRPLTKNDSSTSPASKSNSSGKESFLSRNAPIIIPGTVLFGLGAVKVGQHMSTNAKVEGVTKRKFNKMGDSISF